MTLQLALGDALLLLDLVQEELDATAYRPSHRHTVTDLKRLQAMADSLSEQILAPFMRP